VRGGRVVIRLLSVQIVKFWSVIKYALQQVERIGVEDSLNLFNRLFASLLADKSQCFVMKGDGGEVKAIMITEISEDLFTRVRLLRIRCLYAFSVVSTDEWDKGFEVVKSMARNEKCQSIVFETANPRIESLGTRIGAVKKSTNMELVVGG
jgi:hypothetical protein